MSGDEIARMDDATRLLVIAPHPDDETLATGGLLQEASQRGAAISVFMLTHGDNNPWPQRWLEKRLHIGAAERRRWGDRRVAEARQALVRLGLDEGVLVSPGWPDLGLTDMMTSHGEMLRATLVAHMNRFSPSLLLVPALADAHPDHSAAHILALEALRASHEQATCLEYLIHGTPAHADVRRLTLGAQQLKRKRDAVLAFHSQMALSRKRFLHLVDAEERYQAVDAAGEMPGARLPWHVPRLLRPCCEVLVHAVGQTWRAPVPASGRIADLVPAGAGADGPVYLKLRLRWRTAWIFDHWGWRRMRT